MKYLSIEGSTFYETPNRDQLAKKSVRFTQGYAAFRACSPSRASIMTGKYVTNHSITKWIGDKYGVNWRTRKRFDSHDPAPAPYSHAMSADEVTIAEKFRDGGYDTFFAGKWHIGDKSSVTPEMAVRLELVFGKPSADHWLRLQNAHDLWQTRLEQKSLHVSPYNFQIV